MTPQASFLNTHSSRAAVVVAALLHGAVLLGFAQYQPTHSSTGHQQAATIKYRPITFVFVAGQTTVASHVPLSRPAPAPIPLSDDMPAQQPKRQHPSPQLHALPHVPAHTPASPGLADTAVHDAKPFVPAIARSDETRLETQPLLAAKPDYAYNPQPDYPVLLREQGVGGVVWLRVWVDSDGYPGEIKLASGSGYRLLDDAALRAVRLWRFTPAKRGDNKLASWVEFPIRFTLNG